MSVSLTSDNGVSSIAYLNEDSITLLYGEKRRVINVSKDIVADGMRRYQSDFAISLRYKDGDMFDSIPITNANDFAWVRAWALS